MNRFNLLAIDMDGTLLNSRSEITSRAINCIRQAVQKGVYVTLATGRTFRSAEYHSRPISLNLPLITYNGALIRESESGTVHLDRRIPVEVAREVAGFAASQDLYLKVYMNEKLYVSRVTEETISFSARHRLEYEAVGDLASFIQEPPTMMVIVESREIVDAIHEELQKKLTGKVLMIRSFPHALDLVNVRAGKKGALKYLAGKLGIPQENVLAIGNEMNDLEMVEWAGMGVVMGNSPETLIKRADYVTCDNDHDGVAITIERFVL